MRRLKHSASIAIASASGRPWPRATDSLSVRIASWGSAAMSWASSSARASDCPVGTTSLASPMASASRASITRPVMMSSMARPMPTMRGRRTVPPSASPMFHRRQVTPKEACSSAMRMSAKQAHSSPPA